MAKGCVYIPKTGKDAGKVFGSKESLAAHMNYTPALADMMAKYDKSGGKMDVDSVTKWLTDNGYIKTTVSEDIKSFFSNTGNQNLAIMEADILKTGKSVVPNISKATPEQRQKIDSDIQELKNKYPEKNITSKVENGKLIIESSAVVSEKKPTTKKTEQGKGEPKQDKTGAAISKWEESGLEILNKYGVERFTDWITNQPFIGTGGFEALRDIADKYGFKYPRTQKEYVNEMEKAGGIDEYGKSMAETFLSYMKPTDKKPTVKKEFPKAPVTDAVKAALKNVDNTTAAIMNLAKVLPTVYESITKQIKITLGKPVSQQVAEAYHNAVENGVEPELVAAVENAVALQEQLKSKPSLSGQIETNETLEMEGVPTGTRVTNKASMDALERKHSDNATKKAVIAAAKKAARTLKSVFPSMDIHIHDDPKQYAAAMSGLKGQINSAGNFSYTTSNDGTIIGRIDINLSNAQPSTVIHEVTHAILLKMFGDNSAAFLDFRKNIEKIISASGNKRLSEFADQYQEIADEIGQAEEYLAELSGILSDKETPLNYGIVRKIAELINKLVSTVTFDKFQPFQDLQDQKDALEFFNTIAQSIKTGTDVSGLAADNIFTNETPNAEGEVGVFNLKSKSSLAAPKASEDPRPWIKKFVKDVDLKKFNGKPFITNMYDYTTAGEVTMGNHTIELMGGKNYVPYMMDKNKKKLGEVSNLAAFNSKENAEGFVRNALEGGASLFAPHSGTMEESWQFQHHTFSELVNLVLDNKILTNEDLIDMFNKVIQSAGNKVNFNQFKDKYFKKYGKEIDDFSSFVKNPKEVVDLLDIQNNFAPKLRKTLSKTLAANAKFKKGIGIENRDQFYEMIMDPLNAGVTGGEIIGVVEFDPTTFQIVKTEPGAVDHHPSFGWTLLAKIKGIYQPTKFYKSYDITDTYTKYNKGGVNVSKKSDGFEQFATSNVKSNAGAAPKIAKFNIKSKPQLFGETGATRMENAEKVLDNLQVARDMEAKFEKEERTMAFVGPSKSAENAQKIRLATGWERGADGMWKLEIPDGQLKPIDLDNMYNDGGVPKAYLNDIYDSKELYDAYPTAKDIRVSFVDSDDFKGSYNHRDREIELAINNFEEPIDMLSTLLHEVQHHIQYMEGFATGSDSSSVVNQIMSEIQRTNKQIEAVKQEKGEPGADVAKLQDKQSNLEDKNRRLNEQVSELIMSAQARMSVKPKGPDEQRAFVNLALKDTDVKRELYIKVAGEVESRNVQRRMGLSEEERANKLLSSTEDVRRRDQLILGAALKGETPTVKSKAQIVYDETGFISTDSMIEIVGANDPTYLGDVMSHILEMGEKLRSGNVGPTDLAKAYMMAVSSIRSGDLTISKFEDAIGQNVDEVFVEKERGKIRTEGAMAYLLTTPEGKRMLDNIGRGKISAKDRAFIAKSMKPFGMFSEGESKFDNLFGSTEDKQINLTNINEFADMLKGGVQDQQQLFKGIAQLKGISQAKVGFVSNFLGIGTRGVIDAREIKGWLRGVVFKGDFTEAEAEMNKQLTKSNKNLTPLQKEILRRMRVVGDAFNIEPALSEYIGHHMIWDAVKNERTTHDGLYLAMKQNEDEFNNRLADIKAKPEIKSKAQLASVEETTKALDEISDAEIKAKINSVSESVKKSFDKQKAKLESGDNVTDQDLTSYSDLKSQSRQLDRISRYGSDVVGSDAIRNEFSDVDEQVENPESKYKKGKQIGKEDFGKTYEADGSGILYRGVSKEDYERIKRQQFVDTDMRGAISRREGMNLAKDPATSATYLPSNKGGYVLAIDPKGLNLFATDADNYIRTYDTIPIESVVKVSDYIAKDNLGAMFMPSKLNETISKAYQKAKEDGSNPEFVKAVEDLVGKPEVKSKAQLADNNAKEVADLYAQMREGGGWAERQKINAILDGDPKLSYIYNNFKEITRMLEDAQLLTKSGNCP
jgi:hypothetical protein